MFARLIILSCFIPYLFAFIFLFIFGFLLGPIWSKNQALFFAGPADLHARPKPTWPTPSRAFPYASAWPPHLHDFVPHALPAFSLTYKPRTPCAPAWLHCLGITSPTAIANLLVVPTSSLTLTLDCTPTTTPYSHPCFKLPTCISFVHRSPRAHAPTLTAAPAMPKRLTPVYCQSSTRDMRHLRQGRPAHLRLVCHVSRHAQTPATSFISSSLLLAPASHAPTSN